MAEREIGGGGCQEEKELEKEAGRSGSALAEHPSDSALGQAAH